MSSVNAKKTMLELHPKHAASHHGWLFWIILIALILGGATSASAWYARAYTDRVFPGVYIGTLDVSGKTHDEAFQALNNRIDELLARGFLYHLEAKTVTVSPLVLATRDPDLSRELVSFARSRAIEEALAVGRGGNPVYNLFAQLRARFRGATIEPKVALRSDDLRLALHQELGSAIDPGHDAAFAITWESGNPQITVVPERAGTDIDAVAASETLTRALATLTEPDITLKKIFVAPTVSAQKVTVLIPVATQILAQGPWVLVAGNQRWEIARETMGSLFTVVASEDGTPHLSVGGPALESLFDKIKSIINQPPQNAKFALEGNRVVEFQSSKPGVALDTESTTRLMIETFLNQQKTEVTAATIVTEPEVTTGEVNTLGIETLLGVGVSNFRNSPRNRIKNIKNGARLLNGTMVKPDEEFSLLAALAPFTIENGYLPELVIKGDRIKPEIGGGLCQLGTTTFRATMNSGLPVTARRNHSIVVSYYNDPSNGNPGTDATIYEPAPDFKFKNDTGAHILITTEVDETAREVRFSFWGRSDGRKGYYSPPVVERWIPAPEEVRIETTDLEPGKEECQAVHNGADTSFTYTVEKSDGALEQHIFDSHYRPLPKTCLVGVEKPPEDQTIETTEPLTPTEAADR